MKTVTAAQLAVEIRKLGKNAPEALEAAMREGAMRLLGDIQSTIADTDPQPVDQGQYKAGWSVQEVDGGAVVGNDTKQAVWIERGRGPGPVPFGPIREWVRRKGIWKGPEVQRVAKQIARQMRAARTPSPLEKQATRAGDRRADRRAVAGKPAFTAKQLRAFRSADRRAAARLENAAATRRERSSARSAAEEIVIDNIARAIQLSISRHGYAPRWVLRRALERLRSPLATIIRRHTKGAIAS